jgi:hypothetical protein
MSKDKAVLVDRIATWARRWQSSVSEGPHANYDVELERCEEMLAQHCIEFLASRGFFPLPLHDRPEREHLYRWIAGEEIYARNKFETGKLSIENNDVQMKQYDLEAWWIRQIVQYLDRARGDLRAAYQLHVIDDGGSARWLEMRAQQALGKALLTVKGACEAAIRVYGPMPMPGVTSGTVEEWNE